MVKDRVIWFFCLMLIGVGFLLGSNTDLFTNIKITDWLTSFGTVGAVVVAMWAVNENHKIDTYKLRVTATLREGPFNLANVITGAVTSRSNPKVILRVVNIGKRPITIEKLCTRENSGVYKYRTIRVKLAENHVGYPTIQPGSFFEAELLDSESGATLEEAKSMEYFIVDALEKHHKAKMILDFKKIDIVEST